MPETPVNDAQPAASSAAPPPSVVTDAVKDGDFGRFRQERLAQEGGKPPSTPPAASSAAPSDDSAASSPAEPAVQAPSTEGQSKAASEPAKPSTANAETRVKELLAERHALRSELEQLRAQLQPRQPQQAQTTPSAASSPAPAKDETAFPNFETWLSKPENAERTYEDYIDARTEYRFEQHDQQRQQREVQAATAREMETRQAAYREQTESFVTEHPDFWETVGPLLQMPVNTPTAQALVDALQTSGPKVLYALAKDQKALGRIVTLPERLALYELGKFEAALSQTVSPSPKVVTSAPEPPTTLGRKPIETGTEPQRALKAGDFGAFRQGRLREEATRFAPQR